jgi:hypothetical protein
MMNNRRAPTPRVPYLPHVYPGGQTIAQTCNSHSMQELCQVWNVNYSDYCPQQHDSNNTYRKGQLTSDLHTVELTPGEHRYEDSYFLNGPKTATTPFRDPPSQNNAMNGTGLLVVVADNDDEDNNNVEKHEPQAKRPCLNGNSAITSSFHKTTDMHETRGTMDRVD